MKKVLLPAAAIVLLTLCFFAFKYSNLRSFKEHEESPAPSDYLWAQRAFPYGSVPSEAYYAALSQTRSQVQSRGNGFDWELAGPTNVGGRITDVAMHASDPQTIYAASASGGVWKSTNVGFEWFPITDDLPSLSIGDIAIDPSDKNTLYVGTGEPNGGGGSITYDGRGVFKSENAGATWVSLGLEGTGSIGRIEVDPSNSNRIFVAAMGHLFSNNPERGLFRTEDGGQNWEKVLFLNDSTGCIDLAIHPFNPDTIYAVTWQRTRKPNKRVYGGPACGIYRSTDGGDTWEKLGAGLPGSNLGRIGIAISPSKPSTLYAIYADEVGYFKGVYKTENSGASWVKLSGGDPGYPGFGWWFGQIRVHPLNPDHVYTLGLDWVESLDGGQSWSSVSNYLHADYHALYIHPANPDFKVVGNDGGVFISTDVSSQYQHRPFPVTQFYTSEINYQNPALFSGGAQDYGTWRSRFGGIDDWQFFNGGDGFVTLVNPLDTSIYYASSQYGGFSGSNGASAPSSSRYNWNTPYVFEPGNPDIMYFGAEKLFKSVNGGLSWTAISTDLSNGPTGQNGVQYGTITSIAVSPLNTKVIWVGTDDGNVWTTSTGGLSWTKVSAGLPKRWVTRVVADLSDENAALVCLSGYRHFDDMAHIYRSSNNGQNWENVSVTLPDVPVNDLIIDPSDPANVWIVATDVGVFFTSDAGQDWQPFSSNLPTVPVTDLTFHAPTRTLLAATFGRAMYKIELPNLTIGTNAPQTIDNVRIAPNPFTENSRISFNLTAKQNLHLELYDLNGKRVKTIFSGEFNAGFQTFELEGNNLSPGVYLIKLKGKNQTGFCKKVVKYR